MKSLFWKNFLVYSLVLLAVFLLFGGAFLTQVDRYAASEKQHILERAAQRAGETTVIFLENFSSVLERIYKVNLAQIAADSEVCLMICDPEGLIAYFYDQNGNTVPAVKVADENALRTVVNGGRYGTVGTFNGTFSESMYIMGIPIMSTRGSLVGVVFAAAPANGAVQLLNNIVRVFLYGVIMSLAIALTASYYLSARMTKPLEQIASAAKSFAMGDFSVRVPVEPTREDEIARLAISFNNMAASLENYEEQRRGFVANVSHDLKTPMTTIAGFVEGILDGTIAGEKQTECLEIISEEVKRLSRLAARMLETSKIEAGGIVLNKTQIDVSEMASRIILSFEQALNKKAVEVDIDMPDGLIVTADRDTLFQAIYNLVDNAAKFVEEKGSLKMNIGASGGFLDFSIVNSGSGIDPAELPYVFDRFYKSDQSRGLNKQGSGLGLYIVKTIINLHGGEVSVSSEQNITKFSFKIPLNG